jgi:hypothetical protein
MKQPQKMLIKDSFKQDGKKPAQRLKLINNFTDNYYGKKIVLANYYRSMIVLLFFGQVQFNL